MLVLRVLLFLSLIMHASCEGKRPSPQCDSETPVSATQVQECAEKMKMTFPAETKYLGYHKNVGMDDMIYLKCSMGRDRLPAFISNTPFRGMQLSKERRHIGNSAARVPWWTPDKARRFESGEAWLDNVGFVQILVDMDAQDDVVVYLFWSET